MNYLVLGNKNNQLLLEKRKAYAKVLSKLLQEIPVMDFEESKILKQLAPFFLTDQVEIQEFLLFPDVASLIQILRYQELSDLTQEYLQHLLVEVVVFLHERGTDLPNIAFSNKEFSIAHKGLFLEGDVTFEVKENQVLVNGEEFDQVSFQQISVIPGHNVQLTIWDKNPLRTMNIHPDQEGNSLTFKPFTQDEWLKVFTEAMDMCRGADEALYEEISFLVKKFVAFGYFGKTHASASYKECVGTLYLSYPDNPVQLLEAIIHESSHNKLNLFSHFHVLIHNDYMEEFYSPYRPDIRHVWGVLLGAHAFIATIHVLLKYTEKKNIKDSRLLDKIARYHFKNELALKVLSKYAKFDSMGNSLMKEMLYVQGLNKKMVGAIDSTIVQNAKKDAVKHLKERIETYPGIKY